MADVEFDDDEKAFLSSRGADTEALGRAYGKSAPEPEDDDEKSSTVRPERKVTEPETGADDDDDDADDDDEDGKPSKHVPHGRFHKERERRRAAQKEAQELRVRQARAEERLAILNELMNRGSEDGEDEAGSPSDGQGGKAPAKTTSALEEADIDPMADFAGAMDQLRRRQAEQAQMFKDYQASQQREQQTAAERQKEERAAATYKVSALQFSQANPDFKDAYHHLMMSYHEELKAFGMADPAQRNAHIRAEEQKLARWAVENNRNPAEVLYTQAKTRGYSKAAPALALDTAEEPAGQEVKAKIKNIDRGQKATGSLSNSGGGAKNGLTMESILDMSDDEFFEKVHKLPVAKRKKILGGG